MTKYKMNKELTKAKELLTKWVELFKPKGNTFISPPPIQVETEQFLRDCRNYINRGEKERESIYED